MNARNLAQLNNFTGLFWIYKQEAIDAFLAKYPMLEPYKHGITCVDATTDYEESTVETDILFEVCVYTRMNWSDIELLIKTGDMSAQNHEITDMNNTIRWSCGKRKYIASAQVELKHFYYSPFTGKITSF